VPHILSSGQVYLRPFEAADAPTYRRWRADADPMALTGFDERAPLSLAQVEQRIARLVDEQGKDSYTFLICLVIDDRAIGEVMLFDLDRDNGSAQLGIFIGETEEWGRGFGTDAVNAIVDFGFGELRLERIWLNVWTENPRAQRAYEKAGFVHEGTLRHDRYEHGEYTDGHMMSILSGEWRARASRA
jgi:RimJ/RimL family protein N-acetyltransferase